MLTSNLSLVRKEVTKFGVGIDIASRMARDEMAMALQQLARNEIRKSGAAQAGGPPVNRTGNLRNSINAEKRRIGFANYTAIVGPQVIYGRVLELGFPNGNKYPYMQPAYMKFRSVAPSIIKKHLSGRGL
jgi:hypothetical protein